MMGFSMSPRWHGHVLTPEISKQGALSGRSYERKHQLVLVTCTNSLAMLMILNKKGELSHNAMTFSFPVCKAASRGWITTSTSRVSGRANSNEMNVPLSSSKRTKAKMRFPAVLCFFLNRKQIYLEDSLQRAQMLSSGVTPPHKVYSSSQIVFSLSFCCPSWPISTATHTVCAETQRWRWTNSRRRCCFFPPLCASLAHSHSRRVWLCGSHYLKSLAVKQRVREIGKSSLLATAYDSTCNFSDGPSPTLLHLPASSRSPLCTSDSFPTAWSVGQSPGTDEEIHWPLVQFSFLFFLFSCRRWRERPKRRLHI